MKNEFLNFAGICRGWLLITCLLSFRSPALASDFPRGLYGGLDSLHWAQFDSLHANQIWNYHWNGYGNYQEYLNLAGRNDTRSVLRYQGQRIDSYWLEYYSCAQYQIYEAEWDYLEAGRHPEGFYHFWHQDQYGDPERGAIDRKNPPGGASWKCSRGASYGPGVMLKGPGETILGPNHLSNWGEQSDWPTKTGERRAREFKTILRVQADLSQLPAGSDTIFHLEIWFETGQAVQKQLLGELYGTGQNFRANQAPGWEEMEVNYWVPDNPDLRGQFNILYRLEWSGKCDFWVDWIKFMDMQRGYYLFYDPEVTKSVLHLISDQCRKVEAGNETKLAGWKQSDEPLRSSFRAHGVINDMARDSLKFPPITPFNQGYWGRRPDLFVRLARPQILDTDIYPYRAGGQVGSQAELDTLAFKLEQAYQACQDTIPFHVTAQAHQHQNEVRAPLRAEILAESYMALAHGAKGIAYFKYISNPPVSFGLVDVNCNHDQKFYDERWQAVHDVFAMLDSVGNLLLSLQRDTAYCVSDNPAFLPPVTGIHFTENDTAYIEVGQFHDPRGNKYLIVVNRRTEAERHLEISVATKRRTEALLQDVYTGEEYKSLSGKFSGISFQAGQGRIFKILTN